MTSRPIPSTLIRRLALTFLLLAGNSPAVVQARPVQSPGLGLVNESDPVPPGLVTSELPGRGMVIDLML
ncbi:MAG: hypothetical protein FD129_972, partial [bacterium]